MRYFFEDCALDTDRRELRREADVVPTTPQVFDLLDYLIRNRERVVSKDDLINAIWNGRNVSDAALTTRLNVARNVIGDTGNEQRLIKTLPRRGFRFIGMVQELPASSDTVASEAVIAVGRLSEAQGGPVTPAIEAVHGKGLPDKPSIVVLPFANLGDDASQDYFADGIVEDISIALGRFSWLFVIASSAARVYKGLTLDLKQIQNELGVRYALCGSIRKDSSRIRIVVQLTDTSTRAHLWADQMEGRLDNIFDMQDRIASQVVAAITPALWSVEIKRAQHKPTENLSAYDLYLRALPGYRRSLAENREALKLLHKAIEFDPSYSTAYGFAARCYQVQKFFGWVPLDDPQLDEGMRLARLAAETGKNDSEALWQAGFVLALLAGEVEHGLALIERSISLNPNSSNALLACSNVRVYLGDGDGALEHVSRAMRLSPLDSMHFAHWHSAASAHFCAGRFEQAADAVDKALKEWPSSVLALRLKVVISGLLGRMDEARDHVRRLLAVHPDASVGWLRALWEAPMRGNPRILAKLLEGARLAGLPEGNEHLNPTA